MHKFKFLLPVLLLCGCSPKISQYFDRTSYIREYDVHIINDSLQLYIKSPWDITYTTDRKALKKIIRQERFEISDPVLVHGKADDPEYEYYITLSSSTDVTYPETVILLDTVIANRTLRFLGIPADENSRERTELDLKRIFTGLNVGEGYRKGAGSAMDVVFRHMNSNKFYSILHEVNEFPAFGAQDEWTKLQMQLTVASFLGDNEFYDTYLKHFESRFEPEDSILNLVKEQSEVDSNVMETIISEARDYRILMMNENHFYPNHRLPVIELLAGLKEIGYSYLALETLGEGQDSSLNLPNAYPTLETGFYSREPNYGNLIRRAKDLGYQFVAYENTESGKDRELGQAENLYDRTFALHPHAKVLVLAGMDHILEKPTESGKKWMAAIFKEKYNMDPLTVSQTHLNLYRKQIDGEYKMLKSELFDNEKLRSVDYLLLNNAKNEFGGTPSFSYKVKGDEDVQIALFYEREGLNGGDHESSIPYFTGLLKKGKTYDLPRSGGDEIHLYAFDKVWNVVDELKIPVESDGNE